jgi:EpsI family protein
MINSTAIRLLVVAAFIPATYFVALAVKAKLKPPGVQMPDWTFNDLPLQLGEWRGQPTQMDAKITAATEAASGTTVSRVYQDAAGHVVLLYGAMFNDPAGGVYHTPINCYRANGWQDTNDVREPLEVSDDLTIPVDVSTWENPNGERLLVVYWYQLGEHVLFDRWDLGLKLRWSLRGRPKWPSLIKVMLQIAAPDPDEAKPVILDFARQVAAWENQPEHRRQMLGGAGSSATPRSSSKK